MFSIVPVKKGSHVLHFISKSRSSPAVKNLYKQLLHKTLRLNVSFIPLNIIHGCVCICASDTSSLPWNSLYKNNFKINTMITGDIFNSLKKRSYLSSGHSCNWGQSGLIFCVLYSSSRLLQILLLPKIRLKSSWSTSYCDENGGTLKFKQCPHFVLYESNYSSDSYTWAD